MTCIHFGNTEKEDLPHLCYIFSISNHLPLLDQVDAGETVSTDRDIHFSSYDYYSTQGVTIFNLTINSASSDSTLVVSNISYQHTSKKEGAKKVHAAAHHAACCLRTGPRVQTLQRSDVMRGDHTLQMPVAQLGQLEQVQAVPVQEEKVR